MKRDDRRKAAALESAVALVDAAERRAIADLHRAGFGYQSIAVARRRLSALRTLSRFVQDPDDRLGELVSEVSEARASGYRAPGHGRVEREEEKQ